MGSGLRELATTRGGTHVAARHVFLLLMLFIQTPATGIAQTLTTYTYTGNPFSVAAC